MSALDNVVCLHKDRSMTAISSYNWSLYEEKCNSCGKVLERTEKGRLEDAAKSLPRWESPE